MSESQHTVIIVSAGSGTRMGTDLPKQYMPVNGKPIVIWTILKFLAFDPDIRTILVIGEGREKHFDPIFKKYVKDDEELGKCNITITKGGKTRFDSVMNGLKLVESSGLVGIHDAVRPMVSVNTIRRCFEVAAQKGSAIPVVEIEDSIRMLDRAGNSPLDRDLLRRVQTPQVFMTDRIKQAYRSSPQGNLTDDASVYEKIFRKITLVKGNYENIKITRPFDLQIARLFLK